jgi:hypothetical protein
MPRRAYLIFGDIEGKLDVLRIELGQGADAFKRQTHPA